MTITYGTIPLVFSPKEERKRPSELEAAALSIWVGE
jgi:hypothetical protein